jgi:putative ABC transport system substrate-binding protein
MKRREFIALVGGAAAATASGPLAARAQQSSRRRKVGILMIAGSNFVDQIPAVDQITRRLQELGWVNGRDLDLKIGWSDGKLDKAQELAKQFVAAECDVIVAQGAITVKILQRETSTIPIVFWLVPDPVGEGLVTSLARPGGNITGFSNYEPSIVTKWLGLLKEVNPATTRVSVLFDPDISPFHESFMHSLAEVALSFHVATTEIPAHKPDEIESKLHAFAQAGDLTGDLLVLPDALTVGSKDIIVALAARLRVPAVYPYRSFVTGGGLLSYGVNLPNHAAETAAYADRILRGASAADLPVQNPTKYELVINLKIAEALGLTIPQSLLATADEVIE